MPLNGAKKGMIMKEEITDSMIDIIHAKIMEEEQDGWWYIVDYGDFYSDWLSFWKDQEAE